MNKKELAKLLFKTKEIQELFESQKFDYETINAIIAEEILKEGTDTVDNIKKISELSRLKGQEFVDKFYDFLDVVGPANLPDLKGELEAARKVRRISPKVAKQLSLEMERTFSDKPIGGAGAAATEKPEKKKKDYRDLEGGALIDTLKADLNTIAKAAGAIESLEDVQKLRNELAKIDNAINSQDIRDDSGELDNYYYNAEKEIDEKETIFSKTKTDKSLADEIKELSNLTRPKEIVNKAMSILNKIETEADIEALASTINDMIANNILKGQRAKQKVLNAIKEKSLEAGKGKDTQPNLEPVPPPAPQGSTDTKPEKKYNNLEDLKANADAIYLTHNGDDKYVFISTNPNIPTDITPDIKVDDKGNERKPGENYYGIEIIGNFYSHNTIKDAAGKDGADIIIVPKYEDIEQQHQNYFDGGAKQFKNKIGGKYAKGKRVRSKVPTTKQPEKELQQTDDVNTYDSLKGKIDNAKSKEEIDETRREIDVAKESETITSKQASTLRGRATRKYNKLPSAPESTKQNKQGSVADKSADVDKINAAAEKLNQVVDGDDAAVEAIKDMDLNSNELKAAVQSIVDDAMGDEAKKAKVKQAEPEIKDLAADAKGNDGKPDMGSIDAAITSALKDAGSASPEDDDEFYVKAHDEFEKLIDATDTPEDLENILGDLGEFIEGIDDPESDYPKISEDKLEYHKNRFEELQSKIIEKEETLGGSSDEVDKEDVKQVQDYIEGDSPSPGNPTPKEVQVAAAEPKTKEKIKKDRKAKMRARLAAEKAEKEASTKEPTMEPPTPTPEPPAEPTPEPTAEPITPEPTAEPITPEPPTKDTGVDPDVKVDTGWYRDGRRRIKAFMKKYPNDPEEALDRILSTPEEFLKEFSKSVKTVQGAQIRQKQILDFMKTETFREYLDEIKQSNENVEVQWKNVGDVLSTMLALDSYISASPSLASLNSADLQEIFADKPNFTMPESMEEFEETILDPIESESVYGVSERDSLLSRTKMKLEGMDVSEDIVNSNALLLFIGFILKGQGVIEEAVGANTFMLLNYLDKFQEEESVKKYGITADEIQEVVSFMEESDNYTEIMKVLDLFLSPKPEDTQDTLEDESIQTSTQEALQTKPNPDLDADIGKPAQEELDSNWQKVLDGFYGRDPEVSSFMKQLRLRDQAQLLFNMIKTLREIEIGKSLVGEKGMEELAALTDEPSVTKPKEEPVAPDTTEKTVKPATESMSYEEQIINEILGKFLGRNKEDFEVEISGENKRQMRTALEAMVDLLKGLKIDIGSYKKYATTSSVDPRYDGSTLKEAMEAKLRVVQMAIKNLVEAMDEEIEEQMNQGYDNDEYDDFDDDDFDDDDFDDDDFDDDDFDDDDFDDEEYTEDEDDTFQESLDIINEEDEGERKLKIQETRRVYDKLREMYLYGLRNSLEENDVPNSKRGAKQMREYVMSEEEFLSYFPRNLIVGGKVMTLGQAHDSMSKTIQRFVNTVRDIVTITKTQRVEGEQLQEAIENLITLTLDVEKIFGTPVQLDEELINRYLEEMGEEEGNQPLGTPDSTKEPEKTISPDSTITPDSSRQPETPEQMLSRLNKGGIDYKDLFASSEFMQNKPPEVQEAIQDFVEYILQSEKIKGINENILLFQSALQGKMTTEDGVEELINDALQSFTDKGDYFGRQTIEDLLEDEPIEMAKIVLSAISKATPKAPEFEIEDEDDLEIKEPEPKGDTEDEDGTSDTDRYADSVRSSQIFDDLDMKVFGNKPAIKELWEILVESIKGGLANWWYNKQNTNGAENELQTESFINSKLFDRHDSSWTSPRVVDEIGRYAEFIFGDESLGLGLDENDAESASKEVMYHLNNYSKSFNDLGKEVRGARLAPFMRFVQKLNKGTKEGEWWRSTEFREIGDAIYKEIDEFYSQLKKDSNKTSNYDTRTPEEIAKGDAAFEEMFGHLRKKSKQNETEGLEESLRLVIEKMIKKQHNY